MKLSPRRLPGALLAGLLCIGIAMLRPGQMDDPLERADRALYQAKREGGGCVYESPWP